MSATVHEVAEGPACGSRVLIVSLAGGLQGRVLLDRGLDIGAVWYAGQPIAWLSPSGERRSGYGDAGEGWHRGWAGGLLTTCGLRHIGPPGDGFGRHGQYSDCSAEQVAVSRQAGRWIETSALVRETDGLDRGLALHRRMRWYLGRGRVRIHDCLVNETSSPVAVPILYHINLGFPFLSADARTTMSGLIAPLGFADRMGYPAHLPDEVTELRLAEDTRRVAVAVRSTNLGLSLQVAWDPEQLGHAHIWRRREPGCYVQAVEPANATLQETAVGRWPVLAPGQVRVTGFDLRVRPDRSSPREAEDSDNKLME